MTTDLRVAVVIPWRGGPGRWRPHAEVREFYAEHFPDWLVYNSPSPMGPFNLAAARNRGVRLFTEGGAYRTYPTWPDGSMHEAADVVVVNDADTLPEPGPLLEAVRIAASSEYIVLPYTEYRSLMDEGTWQYRRGHPLQACAHFIVDVACSGVLVARPDTWWSIGGQDEGFRGWGPEDMAFLIAHRVLLGRDFERVEGRVYGQGHPPAVKEGPLYDEAVTRYQQYLAAGDAGDADAIRRLVGGGDAPVA